MDLVRHIFVQVHLKLQAAIQIAFQADPDYSKKALSVLNREAVRLQKSEQYVESIAAYAKLFLKVKERNLIHAELYTCYSNRAAAFIEVRVKCV